MEVVRSMNRKKHEGEDEKRPTGEEREKEKETNHPSIQTIVKYYRCQIHPCHTQSTTQQDGQYQPTDLTQKIGLAATPSLSPSLVDNGEMIEYMYLDSNRTNTLNSQVSRATNEWDTPWIEQSVRVQQTARKSGVGSLEEGVGLRNRFPTN